MSSFSSRFRQRRMLEFYRRFPNLESCRLLDLGGTLDFWETVPIAPRELVVVNLAKQSAQSSVRGQSVCADACDFDTRDWGEFDIVFSNSLIEHVGGIHRRETLALSIRRAAPHYWVQTPNRYFPIEPHWQFPGLQFLPMPARVQVAQRWHFGHMKCADYDQAVEACLWTELLSATEFRSLFPDGMLWKERVAGVTKSLVMVK